jgi:hypothetical protein
MDVNGWKEVVGGYCGDETCYKVYSDGTQEEIKVEIVVNG